MDLCRSRNPDNTTSPGCPADTTCRDVAGKHRYCADSRCSPACAANEVCDAATLTCKLRCGTDTYFSDACAGSSQLCYESSRRTCYNGCALPCTSSEWLGAPCEICGCRGLGFGACLTTWAGNLHRHSRLSWLLQHSNLHNTNVAMHPHPHPVLPQTPSWEACATSPRAFSACLPNV